jgi:hypothetical protein
MLLPPVRRAPRAPGRRFPERFLLPLLQASLVARFLQETSNGANAKFNGIDQL